MRWWYTYIAVKSNKCTGVTDHGILKILEKLIEFIKFIHAKLFA
jgi:hypothetical protein